MEAPYSNGKSLKKGPSGENKLTFLHISSPKPGLTHAAAHSVLWLWNGNVNVNEDLENRVRSETTQAR